MIILHLNANSEVASTLRQFQKSSKVEVHTIGERTLPGGKGLSPDEIIEQLQAQKITADIVHIHDLNLLSSKKPEQFLRNLRAQTGGRLVLSLGLETSSTSEQITTTIAEISVDLIDRYFDLTLVHEGSLLALGDNLSTSSWLPYPVKTKCNDGDDECAIPEGSLSIQVAYPDTSKEFERCAEIVSELKNAGHPISIAPLVLSDGEMTGDGDILIERLGGEGYGYLAVLGLASGRTVLSSNPAHLRNRSKQLEMSSVVDTNWETLKTRLESLLRERRSLRDFNKRSKQYVNNFHRGDLIAAELVEMYRQLI